MSEQHHHHRETPAQGAVDPVCGMTVDPHTAKFRAEHHGHPYYFCSAACRTKFVADPQKYLGAREPEQVDESAIYTCSTHPEIRQVGPGSCPICGMALEPRTVTREEDSPELRDMTRRFWISFALTLPLLGVAMGSMFWRHGVMALSWQRLLPWLELLLATPVVLWGGRPFFQRGWASIVNRSTNMFTLIAMGTGVAYLYSVVATLFPSIFPASFSSMAEAGREANSTTSGAKAASPSGA